MVARGSRTVSFKSGCRNESRSGSMSFRVACRFPKRWLHVSGRRWSDSWGETSRKAKEIQSEAQAPTFASSTRSAQYFLEKVAGAQLRSKKGTRSGARERRGEGGHVSHTSALGPASRRVPSRAVRGFTPKGSWLKKSLPMMPTAIIWRLESLLSNRKWAWDGHARLGRTTTWTRGLRETLPL